MPAPPSGATPSGGAPSRSATGALPIGRSGGGGGGSDELVAYAVIAIAVASLAVVGLGATEGMRFDGDAAVWPGQLVYLQGDNGTERPVPLHLLAAADLAGVEGGVIRDDEGYGLQRLGRAPLNRRGFAFKVDLGSNLTLDRDVLAGFASHIQAGYFPHQRVGLLAGVSLAGLWDEAGDSIARHAFTGELQLFPLSWWRLHLGAAGHVGSGLVPGGDGRWGALTAGVGGLLEVALTTRLALTARWDWTHTRAAPGHWLAAQTLSAGLAVY